jgi:hypothetical protein
MRWAALLTCLYCLSTGSKATDPTDHELKPLKPFTKIFPLYMLTVSSILLQCQKADLICKGMHSKTPRGFL